MENLDNWRALAECATTDPEIFFPTHMSSNAAKVAKRICEECVVREECLTEALYDPPEFGIWAGYPAEQLKRIGGRN